MSTDRKSILYFEDDPESMRDYYVVLSKQYDVTLGSHKDLVEQRRRQPIDLLIVDLMIHSESPNIDNEFAESVSFEGTNWQQTGVKFIEYVRDGRYSEYGIPADVPIIVATAVMDYAVQERVQEIGVEKYMEKPFTMDDFEHAVDRVLNG